MGADPQSAEALTKVPLARDLKGCEVRKDKHPHEKVRTGQVRNEEMRWRRVVKTSSFQTLCEMD